MKLIIYGADKSGRRALEVCIAIGFEVIAFVDADIIKSGKKINDISILGINSESETMLRNNVVMMGTNSKEAYRYVASLSDKVIDINVVNKLYATYGNKNWPKTSLQSQHIQNCRLLPKRIDLLHNLPKGGVVAEIGVFQGELSKYILDICNPDKLYLIDLWEDDESNSEQYECVKQRFRNEITTGKVEIIKSDSVKAIMNMEDKQLDWVFLDTVHDYLTPHKELEAVKTKVKNNGFICGHDYAKFNLYERIELGVWSAVNEFAVNNNYEFIYLTFEEDGLQSFAIRKISAS